MKDVMDVDLERILQDDNKARIFIAVQYLNASEYIVAGLKRQHKDNKFHFVITLRSFIEYTRRGTWFLCWAKPEQIKRAYKLTFDKPGSPGLVKMDEMINEALGKGKVSALTKIAQGIGEPFINSLHALTHGNPISVRFLAFGLDPLFDTEMLLVRAETDLNIFRILVYRMMLGEKQEDIWSVLGTIHNRPPEASTQAIIAAKALKDAGGPEKFFS
jgi:hypothetical protein